MDDSSGEAAGFQRRINYPTHNERGRQTERSRVEFVGGLPFCRHTVGGMEIAVQVQRPAIRAC